jgi:hypothetical protein
MMLTCEKCGRKQPLTDDDIAAFHPRFFCLSCGARLTFQVPEPRLRDLGLSNDRARTLSQEEIAAVPAEAARRVVKSTGESSGGGG